MLKLGHGWETTYSIYNVIINHPWYKSNGELPLYILVKEVRSFHLMPDQTVNSNRRIVVMYNELCCIVCPTIFQRHSLDFFQCILLCLMSLDKSGNWLQEGQILSCEFDGWMKRIMLWTFYLTEGASPRVSLGMITTRRSYNSYYLRTPRGLTSVWAPADGSIISPVAFVVYYKSKNIICFHLCH